MVGIKGFLRCDDEVKIGDLMLIRKNIGII